MLESWLGIAAVWIAITIAFPDRTWIPWLDHASTIVCIGPGLFTGSAEAEERANLFTQSTPIVRADAEAQVAVDPPRGDRPARAESTAQR
jgi:hypothetical protein